MKKYFLILVCLTFLLSGCNSYIELNDLAIINAIGLTKENDNYKLYTTIVKNDLETLEATTTLYETTGNSLNEIIDNLSSTLSKKIYMSHLEVLLVDETIKESDYKAIVNYFLNNNETREDFLIAITDNIKKTLEKCKFQEINELLENNHQETSKTVYTTMYDVINNYYEKKPLYLPFVVYDDKLKLTGIKLFNHSNYEKIKEDMVLYYNYLLNNVDTYKFNFKCASNKYLYLNVLKANTTSLNDKLIITNEIKVITNDCNYDIKKIENIFNTNLNTNMSKLTNKNLIIKNTIRGNYEKN